MDYKRALIGSTTVIKNTNDCCDIVKVANDCCDEEVNECGDILECQTPNCQKHKLYCEKCEKSTIWVKVFKLSDRMSKLAEENKISNYTEYVFDKVCTFCFKLNNDSEYPDEKNRNDELYHHLYCFTRGYCRCNYYYCRVEGCKKYCLNKNQSWISPAANDELSKCRGHRIFCIQCERETFWVIKNSYPNHPNDDYVCTDTICGPCFGYVSTYY